MSESEILNRLDQLGDRLLKPREAAPFLAKAEGTLRNERAAGTGCPYIKNGKAVAYHPVDIAQHVRACRRATAAA